MSPGTSSETPAVEPAALVITDGWLAEARGECACRVQHNQGCRLGPVMPLTELAALIQRTTTAPSEGDPGTRADAIGRVRRFVDAYSAAKEGLDTERVATFDDHRLLLSDLRVLIGGAE